MSEFECSGNEVIASKSPRLVDEVYKRGNYETALRATSDAISRDMVDPNTKDMKLGWLVHGHDGTISLRGLATHSDYRQAYVHEAVVPLDNPTDGSNVFRSLAAQLDIRAQPVGATNGTMDVELVVGDNEIPNYQLIQVVGDNPVPLTRTYDGSDEESIGQKLVHGLVSGFPGFDTIIEGISDEDKLDIIKKFDAIVEKDYYPRSIIFPRQVGESGVTWEPNHCGNTSERNHYLTQQMQRLTTAITDPNVLDSEVHVVTRSGDNVVQQHYLGSGNNDIGFSSSASTASKTLTADGAQLLFNRISDQFFGEDNEDGPFHEF